MRSFTRGAAEAFLLGIIFFGIALFVVVAMAACGGSPAELAVEPEPVCTLYVVSAITGDTTVVENPAPIPPGTEYFDGAAMWRENCDRP